LFPGDVLQPLDYGIKPGRVVIEDIVDGDSQPDRDLERELR
jgi:hypothetical protein